MFKHEKETIFILVSKKDFSTDLYLQEVISDTFFKKIDIEVTADKQEHIILEPLLK